jgi:hypothetical protein
MLWEVPRPSIHLYATVTHDSKFRLPQVRRVFVRLINYRVAGGSEAQHLVHNPSPQLSAHGNYYTLRLHFATDRNYNSLQ